MYGYLIIVHSVSAMVEPHTHCEGSMSKHARSKDYTRRVKRTLKGGGLYTFALRTCGVELFCICYHSFDLS